MVTVSLCMIVKNEEKVIARCLDSVKDFVDEIIIVDTGSTDNTKKIIKSYTDKIYDFQWINDFAAARNFSFSKATKEYTLWLDADDVLIPADGEQFLQLKNDLDNSVDSVRMNYVLGKDDQGNITSSLKRNRLVKTSKKFQWIGVVHEYLHVYGKIISHEISVTHLSIKTKKTDRNLKIYEQQLSKGKEFSPRDLYYYANECYEHGMYERAFAYYRKFIDTKKGWVEDCISAFEKGADSLLNMNKTDEAERFLYESFLHDVPRANLCYKLGYIYFLRKDFYKAVYWYKAATECDMERVKNSGTIINYAYFTWLPHLQLCVCYDAMGQYEQSYYHNEIARSYQPDNASILHNKKYLETILQRKKIQ